MGQLTNEAVKSIATEAIVSIDGTIQRRIPNYETTVNKVSNDNFVAFPALAANDAEDIIPVLLDTVSAIDDIDSSSPNIRSKRHGVSIVGTIIVVTFVWSIYSLFFSNKNNVIEPEAVDAPITLINNFSDSQQLKRIADLILSDNRWSSDRISTFLIHWNKLDKSTTRKVKTSSWYQLFSFSLKQRVKQYKNIQSASNKDDSLLKLAKIAGILNANGEVISEQQGSSKYRQLIDELTKEIVQVDKTATNTATNNESEAVLNAKLRERYSVPSAVVSTPLKAERNGIKHTNQSSETKITIAEIKQLIHQYEVAYVAGDMQTISQLFGASVPGKKVSKRLAASFSTIFGNSDNRSIKFYDVESQVSGSSATVTSKFNASLELKNNKGTQYIVADTKMEIIKRGNTVTISSFNILNRKVNVITPTNNHSLTASEGIKPVVGKNIPTPAELQDVTTQLVTAYETGDIDRFLSLFSNEIKTNDRIDLEGVKQDYSELFRNSTDRQMFIQNLKWSNESIGSKGVGDLEVIILSEEGGTVYSMEGKIQIVAQKIEGKILITHLYHIERKK